MFILIVTHPRIIPHDSVKNRILLLKNYKIVNSLLNKAQSGPNKLSSKLPCSKPTAHAINSNCCSSLTCLYVCSRIGSMLEQVRSLVVIKISVVTISVTLFILLLKIIFTCVKIVAHPRLMPHCGIIWVHITYILGMKIIVPQGY